MQSITPDELAVWTHVANWMNNRCKPKPRMDAGYPFWMQNEGVSIVHPDYKDVDGGSLLTGEQT